MPIVRTESGNWKLPEKILVTKNYESFAVVVEELEEQVQNEKDRLAEKIFRKLVDENIFHFFLKRQQGTDSLHEFRSKKRNAAL